MTPDIRGPSQDSGAAASSLLVKTYSSLTAGSEAQGKFVLLAKGKSLHLILSPVSLTPYHANIVYQYLQVEGRGSVENAGESGCHILSKAWSVHGGGYYHVQNWLHNIRLHGKSTAFGKYKPSLLGPHADQIPFALGLEAYTLELS